MTLKTIFSNPLVQFFAAAAVIFGLYAYSADRSTQPAGTITIPISQQQNLAALFQMTWQRPPTASELAGLIEEQVREELLYREALALGLDSDDVVVRRRLAQKMEFIVDDLASLSQPTDQVLAAFLEKNSGKYVTEPVVTFEQVFISGKQQNLPAREKAATVLAELTSGSNPSSAGDTTLLPQDMKTAPLSAVARVFGEDFASSVGNAPVGEWAGPITSAFGLHLVRVRDRQAQRAPGLEEVRQQVERDWRESERQRNLENYISSLKKKYEINIENVQRPAE
jgi:hypothetical protein